MTTAHRPTWAPAMGGEEQGGNRMVAPSKMQSAKDMPSHKIMKTRAPGQNTAAEVVRRDLRAELEARERKHFKLDKLEDFEKARQEDMLLIQQGGDSGRQKMLVPRAQDADDEDSGSGSDSESDDDEDDMEALQAELERIKQERQLEKDKAEAAAKEKADKERREELIKSNPALREQLGLPADEPSFGVKRRWDDDVVFKNQARTEPKKTKRFINDTVRSDFHRRFLDRYIK